MKEDLRGGVKMDLKNLRIWDGRESHTNDVNMGMF